MLQKSSCRSATSIGCSGLAYHHMRAGLYALRQISSVALVSQPSQDSTTSSHLSPVASLLTYEMDLLLAAFMRTSGCSLTDLFYEDTDTPETLGELCEGYEDATCLSLNQALLASADISIPLLQVCLPSASTLLGKICWS